MKFHNKILNTYPFICHAQGQEHYTGRWKNICNQPLPISNLPENLSIVTFIYGQREFSLKKQLEKNNLPYLNFINPDIKFWMNRFKIKYLCDYLDTVTTDYILCLDSIDTILCDDMTNIVEEFLKFDTDILYNSTVTNYPILTFEEDTTTKFKYLNAGVFIGKTKEVKEFYTFIYENYYETGKVGSTKSEQHRVRVARELYPQKDRIKVDTECIMFQTLGGTEYAVNDEILTIF